MINQMLCHISDGPQTPEDLDYGYDVFVEEPDEAYERLNYFSSDADFIPVNEPLDGPARAEALNQSLRDIASTYRPLRF